jgi:hypothetical protein
MGASIKMQPSYRGMNQQINDIIRNQWPMRHSADEHMRTQARNLILAHVSLARNLTAPSGKKPSLHAVDNLIAPLYLPVLHAA